MNSIYKNKILYILNIIVKTETLNCRYLVSKSLVVSVSDTRNMWLKIVQTLSAEGRHRICD